MWVNDVRAIEDRLGDIIMELDRLADDAEGTGQDPGALASISLARRNAIMARRHAIVAAERATPRFVNARAGAARVTIKWDTQERRPVGLTVDMSLAIKADVRDPEDGTPVPGRAIREEDWEALKDMTFTVDLVDGRVV